MWHWEVFCPETYIDWACQRYTVVDNLQTLCEKHVIMQVRRQSATRIVEWFIFNDRRQVGI